MSATRRFAPDLTYSDWHRPARIDRYVGALAAGRLTMIDLDGVEYCGLCSEPLALLEMKRAGGEQHTTVLVRLARRAGLPAYCVWYWLSEPGADDSIERFLVRQVWPEPGDRAMLPAEFAAWLVHLRDMHEATACERRRN